MRIIKPTSQFKKDYKREKKGKHKKTIVEDLKETLTFLVKDKPLPKSYFDHPLTGEWKDCRDCHIKPDLILIYRKKGESTLDLIRLGSHSELGL